MVGGLLQVDWESFLDNLKIFEKIFVSCKIGIIKPERKCYKFVLDSLKVSANQCLLIDDRKENIEVAKQMKMKTILFVNAYYLRKALKAKLE